MNRVSTARVAATLILAGLALSSPAVARDKKEAAPQGPVINATVRTAGAAAQTALAARDVATATPLVAQVEAAAQNDDEKYVAYLLRYNLEVARLHAANGGAAAEQALAGPLDNLLSSPKTPAADKAAYANQRGIIAYNAKQYAVAVKSFTDAKAGGFTDANLDLEIIRSKVQAGDVAGGLADLDAMSQRTKPSEDLYRFAIATANQHGMKPQTLDWSRKYLAAYPTARNYRDVLVTYGMTAKPVSPLNKQQMIDVYRLLSQAKALAGQGDYEDYAEKVQSSGLPDEAKRVIADGRSAGKIPPNSVSANAIAKAADNAAQTGGPLAALATRAAASANGQLAAQTGDAYLGQRNFAKAIELYTLALQKGGVAADDVNTHLGIARTLSGDKAGALTAFQAVTAAPRSEIAQFWITYLNNPTTA